MLVRQTCLALGATGHNGHFCRYRGVQRGGINAGGTGPPRSAVTVGLRGPATAAAEVKRNPDVWWTQSGTEQDCAIRGGRRANGAVGRDHAG